MGMVHEFLRRHFFQFFLHGEGCLSFSQACPVAYAEQVCVDGDGGFTKGNVENHVGCLAADTRQLLESLPVPGHGAGVLVDEHLTEFDDIFGFRIKEADGFDMVFDPGFAEFDHFLRRIGDFKQGLCGFVDPHIGGLGGQHDSHQQCVGVNII